jgi:prepilin-type N-terminal cleavage/methylation domain-containing protein
MSVVPCRRRGGFTLVELLVVLAVIALLAGLLLPAVERAREAGYRISCANNLKQIAMAMHLYHHDYEVLPPSRLPGGGATWAVLILPYMEQSPLYRQWDLKQSYYRQSDVARQTRLENYFCPSRRAAFTAPDVSISGDEPDLGGYYGAHVPGALADYAVNIGTSGMDTD